MDLIAHFSKNLQAWDQGWLLQFKRPYLFIMTNGRKVSAYMQCY